MVFFDWTSILEGLRHGRPDPLIHEPLHTRAVVAALGLSVALTCSAAARTGSQLVVVVRHGEKAEMPKDDVALSEARPRPGGGAGQRARRCWRRHDHHDGAAPLASKRPLRSPHASI